MYCVDPSLQPGATPWRSTLLYYNNRCHLHLTNIIVRVDGKASCNIRCVWRNQPNLKQANNGLVQIPRPPLLLKNDSSVTLRARTGGWMEMVCVHISDVPLCLRKRIFKCYFRVFRFHQCSKVARSSSAYVTKWRARVQLAPTRVSSSFTHSCSRLESMKMKMPFGIRELLKLSIISDLSQ